MIALQLWRLKALCREYGVDFQEIDYSLTYDENKKHLMSLVPTQEKDSMREAKSQQEWYMTHHFVSFYLNCAAEGKTSSSEEGDPPGQKRFSLSQWIIKRNV